MTQDKKPCKFKIGDPVAVAGYGGLCVVDTQQHVDRNGEIYWRVIAQRPGVRIDADESDFNYEEGVDPIYVGLIV